MAKKFNIIVAHDLNYGIGVNNQIPWHLPVDMSYFKEKTTASEESKKNAVIMGRKTWESIPEKFRPLPNRLNIILSKTQSKIDGIDTSNSFDDALQICNENKTIDNIFVIGGSQIYEEAIKHKQCDTLFITKVYKSCECDAFFPSYKPTFKCTYASNIWVTSNGNCAFFKYKK